MRYLLILLTLAACDGESLDEKITKEFNAAPHEGDGESHLRNIRQLTNGGENAEAYWSFDETQLIFQSTRPPFTADQIFTMGADGSNQTLVSTGKGRTTCAYFLPGDKKILYASTHAAGRRAAARPPIDRRGYVWADLRQATTSTLRTRTAPTRKNLTNSPGYDAEATISPDG